MGKTMFHLNFWFMTPFQIIDISLLYCMTWKHQVSLTPCPVVQVTLRVHAMLKAGSINAEVAKQLLGLPPAIPASVEPAPGQKRTAGEANLPDDKDDEDCDDESLDDLLEKQRKLRNDALWCLACFSFTTLFWVYWIMHKNVFYQVIMYMI